MTYEASYQNAESAIDVAALELKAEESRIARERALNLLIEDLKRGIRIDGNFDFAGLMRVTQKLLDLDDLELSRVLKVARPTIGRWMRGISTPHTLTRRAILDALLKKANAEARALKA